MYEPLHNIVLFTSGRHISVVVLHDKNVTDLLGRDVGPLGLDRALFRRHDVRGVLHQHPHPPLPHPLVGGPHQRRALPLLRPRRHHLQVG